MGKRVLKGGVYRTQRRKATTMDMVLLYLFAFLCGAILTILALVYMIFRRNTPQFFRDMSGNDVYNLLAKGAIIGGVIGMILLYYSLSTDPYKHPKENQDESDSEPDLKK